MFVKGVRWGLCLDFFFFFCMWVSHCSSSIVEKMVFCPLNILCAFVKDQLLYLCGSISGLSILLRGSVCLFFGPYLLVRFYSKTGGQATSGAWLCASPVLQQLLWVFRFPCQVRVSFSVFWEMAVVELKTRVSLCGLFVFLSLSSPCGPRLAPYLVSKLPPYLLLRVPLSRPQRFLLPYLSFADLCCFTPRLS